MIGSAVGSPSELDEGANDRHVGAAPCHDETVAEKPEKPFMTKGAERVLYWTFMIPIILLIVTFVVLAAVR